MSLKSFQIKVSKYQLHARVKMLLVEYIQIFLHFLKNMPEVITGWSVAMGPLVYVLIFAIIFSETGLVILPFLPGDSLLFTLGALAAVEHSNLNLWTLILVLPIAALGGDFLNYNIGKFAGRRFLTNDSGWINKKHLARTQEFYRVHGGKTIIFARFVPIVRTYAPFVAGIGQMKFTQFFSFSVAGAYAWIVSFLMLGYFFGNIPTIKTNFHYVIIAIILISVLPALIEYLKAKKQASVDAPAIRELRK